MACACRHPCPCRRRRYPSRSRRVEASYGDTSLLRSVGHAVLSNLVFGACGDKYKDYLSVGGNDPAEPCGAGGLWACSGNEAKQWEARADEVFGLVLNAWNQLMAVENQTGDYTASDKVRGQADAFWAQHQAMTRLRAISGPFHVMAVVQSAYDVTRAGTCTLERINGALASVGGGSVEPPQAHEDEGILDDLGDGAAGLSTALLLGGGLVLAVLALGGRSR
jgi:hypothetical protein